MITWIQGKIIEKKQWCEALFSLTIKTNEPLKFKAGQFILIGLNDGDTITYRPYSLINVPEDTLVEVHFNTVKDGTLSPRLADLKPGDAIQVSNRPSGLLTLDETPNAANLWLFATGTGIGPFISILKTAEPWQRFEKVVLCYAVKTLEGMAYSADFKALVKRYPKQFHFVPFVTREHVADTFNSRITHHIDNGKLEDYVGVNLSPESSHVMLCGNANMINDMTTLLEHKGLRRHSRHEPGHIAIEKYY